MALKGKIEAIIYAAEEPVTLAQIAYLMKEPVLTELAAEQARAAEEATELAVQEPAELGQSGDTDPTTDDSSAVIVDDSSTPDVSAETSPSVAQAEADVEQLSPQQTAEAAEPAPVAVSPKKKKNEVPPEVKARVRALIEELIADYENSDRGIEVRQLAGGYRMATKPEHHDIVKAFAKSLKPPLRLSLPALETLAVVAYKQPVTAPEVSDIRGVDSQGVMATLLERKLVTTAGRKAVIGRPILYKTTKEFLLRFGLNDTSELPSMEEFEKLAQKEFFHAEPDNEPEEAAPELEFRSDEESIENDASGNASAVSGDATAADADQSSIESAPEPVEHDAPEVN